MFAFPHTHSTVTGCLLQTLFNELGIDESTRQLVRKWVHQSHTSCVPPSLCLSVTHLMMMRWGGLKCQQGWKKTEEKHMKLFHLRQTFQGLLLCVSLWLKGLSLPVLFVNGFSLLQWIIWHSIAADHESRTQISNKIRTLELFTNNKSLACSELGVLSGTQWAHWVVSWNLNWMTSI